MPPDYFVRMSEYCFAYSTEIDGTSSQFEVASSLRIGIARSVMNEAARKSTHAAITQTYAQGLMTSANVSASWNEGIRDMMSI